MLKDISRDPSYTPSTQSTAARLQKLLAAGAVEEKDGELRVLAEVPIFTVFVQEGDDGLVKIASTQDVYAWKTKWQKGNQRELKLLFAVQENVTVTHAPAAGNDWFTKEVASLYISRNSSSVGKSDTKRTKSSVEKTRRKTRV